MPDYPIRGKEWHVKTEHLASDTDGECLHSTRTIRLARGLRGKSRLWTLVHEVLHAALPDLSEDAVDATAFSLAEVLWGERYRRR